jgi:RNA polymerase sigma factor (sigma-70 family)
MDYKNIIDEELLEKVYLYSYNKLNNKIDAEDLTQDILVEVLTELKKGKEIHSFYSWFWAVAHNKYCKFLDKKKKIASTVSFDDGYLTDIVYSGASVEDELLSREEIAQLNYAISRLSVSHREMVVMFYLKEMKISDIAGSLNIPVGTVKRRLFDMRTNLKKGFENMSNTTTRKSAYVPSDLNIWGNGSPPFGTVSDLIIKQLLVACRDEGKTLNDLADEIHVAPVYLEDRLKAALEAKVMKTDKNGKYLTDILIVPGQAHYDAKYKASEIYSGIGPEIHEMLLKKKDYIQSLDFHGNKFDYRYLTWFLYILVYQKYAAMTEKYNAQNWEGKIPENNGKNFRLSGEFVLPGETINRDKEIKEVRNGNRGEYFQHSKYGRILYIDWFVSSPFADKYRHGKVNGSNAPLIFKLIDNNGIAELTDVEEKQAAELIENGVIIKDGEKLNVMIPFMTAEIENTIRDCFEDLLQPLVEKYTDKITTIVNELILPHVREDLMEEYAHCVLGSFFTMLPCAMYWAAYEGKTLPIPEDFLKSAAGIVMIQR